MQLGAQKNPYEDLLTTSYGGLDQTPNIAAPTVPGGAGSPTSTPSTAQATSAEQAPGNADITSHLSAFTSSASPVMQAARTRGLQAANQRGLLNSTMGIQAAENAVYDVALPAASQMAAQGHQTQIADKNIASYDREKAASLAAAYQNTYAQMFSAIASNANLPADVRNSYMAHLGAMRDSNMGLLEQMYGISLDWETPEVPTTGDSGSDGNGGGSGSGSGPGSGSGSGSGSGGSPSTSWAGKDGYPDVVSQDGRSYYPTSRKGVYQASNGDTVYR